MAGRPKLRKQATAATLARQNRAKLLEKNLEEREAEATFMFHKFDVSQTNSLDEDELFCCFAELGFSNGRQNKTEEEMRKWVRQELSKHATEKGDGKLSYEEFVKYYNKFVVCRRRKFEETYELGAKIGEGAFGFVYRAKQIGGTGSGAASSVADEQQVAVKKVRKHAESESVHMEMLRNEITIWEQLKHPNLVRLIDVFESPEHLYLVTELMRGGDLFKKLEKQGDGKFSEAEAARLARQIVSAVSYLHEHGVVHCDLKPSNILVVEPNAMDVKIADFGLSQSMQGMAKGKLTEVCGTPEYFAPELAEIAQRNATKRSAEDEGDEGLGGEDEGYGPPLDCWAVGCIVYELLAGGPPFTANDENVLFYRIIDNAPDLVHAPFDSISPPAIDLIKQLLTSDPAERLSCVDALSHPWLQEGQQQSAPLPPTVHVNRRKSLGAREDTAAAAAAAAAAAVPEVDSDEDTTEIANAEVMRPSVADGASPDAQ